MAEEEPEVPEIPACLPSFPAARLTDVVSHDGVSTAGVIGPPLVPPTSGPVVIENLPAAYVGCTVVCSGASSAGPVHPPPGPTTPPVAIILGSPSVLINGKPAARWVPSGDITACTAQLGAAPLTPTRTVFIGGPVMPGNMPFSLDPNGNLRLGDSIQIEGDDLFKSRVADALVKIASVSEGQKALAIIEQSGKQVLIQDNTGSTQGRSGGNHHRSADPRAATVAGQPVPGLEDPVTGAEVLGTGEGSDALISYNPTYKHKNPLAPKEPVPTDAVLFHELTHASHSTTGRVDRTPDPTYDNQEEKSTISSGSPNESEYLKQRGYKWHRTDHSHGFARHH